MPSSDPIQEQIDIATGDAEASVAALAAEVAALSEELESVQGALDEASTSAEGLGDATGDAGEGASGATGSIRGLSGVVRLINPELGTMVGVVGAAVIALPKLAAGIKLLPLALGPLGAVLITATALLGALTLATEHYSDIVDEVDSKLKRSAMLHQRTVQGIDALKDITSDLIDEQKLLLGSTTEAAIAQREFNAAIDKNVALVIKNGRLTGEQADRQREKGVRLKELFANNEALRQAERDRAQAAKDSAQADRDAATAAGERALAEALLAAELIDTISGQNAVAGLERIEDQIRDIGEAIIEAYDQDAIDAAGDAMVRAMEKAARAQRALEITQSTGAVAATGGDPLALLGMIPGVGGAIAGGLGGLARLGAKSDEELDEMFGGLADDIISGVERLPDLFVPLVVDFAFALATELPGALLEAGAQLIVELARMIQDAVSDTASLKETATSTAGLALISSIPGVGQIAQVVSMVKKLTAAEERIRDGMDSGGSSRSARFNTSSSDLSSTDASPALDRVISRRASGRPGTGGGSPVIRGSIRLHQAGIFGTEQEIRLSTGPGGLRERQ